MQVISNHPEILLPEIMAKKRMASGKEANGEWRMVQSPLFAIPYSLFPIPYSLPATHDSLLAK
jgi:hypothetical protein